MTDNRTWLDRVAFYYTLHLPILTIVVVFVIANPELQAYIGLLPTILAGCAVAVVSTLCFLIGPMLVSAVKTAALIGLLLMGLYMLLMYWHSPDLQLTMEINKAAAEIGISPYWAVLALLLAPLDWLLMHRSEMFD